LLARPIPLIVREVTLPLARIVFTSLLLLLAQAVATADVCMVRAGDARRGLRPQTCAMDCEQQAEALGETCLDGDGDPPGCEALARDALDNCLGGCGAPGPTCAETCAIVARAGDEAELLAHHEKLGGTTHSRRLLRRCVRRCTA